MILRKITLAEERFHFQDWRKFCCFGVQYGRALSGILAPVNGFVKNLIIWFWEVI